MIVRLEKLSELPDALHPNNVEIGFVKEGPFVAEPKVGENFWVGSDWRTSTVKEIINEGVFKTCNSIYVWDIFEY
jgi:hypothetical protein